MSLVVIMLGQGLRRQKGVRLWLLLYLATVAMTLRAGGIGASGILLLALRYERQAVRLTWKKAVSAAGVAFCLGYPQVRSTFQRNGQVEIVRQAGRLAEYFPGGSGCDLWVGPGF